MRSASFEGACSLEHFFLLDCEELVMGHHHYELAVVVVVPCKHVSLALAGRASCAWYRVVRRPRVLRSLCLIGKVMSLFALSEMWCQIARCFIWCVRCLTLQAVTSAMSHDALLRGGDSLWPLCYHWLMCEVMTSYARCAICWLLWSAPWDCVRSCTSSFGIQLLAFLFTSSRRLAKAPGRIQGLIPTALTQLVQYAISWYLQLITMIMFNYNLVWLLHASCSYALPTMGFVCFFKLAWPACYSFS